MSAPQRLRTTVLEGGRIEVCAPSLAPGQIVDVTIQPTDGSGPCRSVLDILADCPGGVIFKSADDVDEHIRQERDSWER